MLSGSRESERPGTNFPQTETAGASWGSRLAPSLPAFDAGSSAPVAGTLSRCPGGRIRQRLTPPPVPTAGAEDPSHRRGGSCRPGDPRATSRAASALQGQCRRCGRRSSPAVPAALGSPGAAPAVPGSTGARLGRTHPVAPNRPLPSCCSAVTFPAPRGESGRHPKSNPRIGV